MPADAVSTVLAFNDAINARDLARWPNVFEDAAEVEAGVVLVRGRSECSVQELDGPAEWRAVVRGGRVEEWRVSSA